MLKDKPFYYSMTFWGCILYGVASAVEQLGHHMYPELLGVAQILGTIIAVMGFRRKLGNEQGK